MRTQNHPGKSNYALVACWIDLAHLLSISNRKPLVSSVVYDMMRLAVSLSEKGVGDGRGWKQEHQNL